MLHKVNIIKKENDEIEMSLNATDEETAEKLAKSINITLDHDILRTEIVPAELTLDDKEIKTHNENCFCSICVGETPKPNPAKSIYHVEIKPGVWVDIYDVLTAFKVTNQATGHAIKKQLKPGSRGYKSIEKDLTEAIKSLERAIEIEAQING